MNLVKRFAVLLLLAFVVGCSHKIDTTKLQNVFQSADGEYKAYLDQGVDAISKTNYAAALDPLEKLAYRPRLTKEQRQELQDVIAKVKDQVRKSK